MAEQFVSPWDPPRRRTWIRRLVVIAIGVMVFPGFPWGMIYFAMQDTATSSIGPGAAFVDLDGREVVIVAYDRYGGGGFFGVPHFIAHAADTRVAAVDTATGAVVWDERIASDHAINEPEVLAEGAGLTYVGTDLGLYIVDTASGEVIRQAEDIEGLDPVPFGEYPVFGYDPSTDAILTLTTDGAMMAVPVGEQTARPAASGLVERWAATLGGAGCQEDCPPALEDGITAPSGATVMIDDDSGEFEGVAVVDGEYQRITHLGPSSFWST